MTSAWDEGIAGTMNDVVSAVLARKPGLDSLAVRRRVAELESQGEIRSRWDGDAHIYWS